mgnify:CR=1 FL=1
MIIEHLNNVLSRDFNNNILNELSNIQGWRISPDERVETQGNLEGSASDSGMLLTSFDKELGFPFTQELEAQYSFLNVSANHIFQSVLQNSKYIFHNICVYYNYSFLLVRYRSGWIRIPEYGLSLIWFLRHI